MRFPIREVCHETTNSACSGFDFERVVGSDAGQVTNGFHQDTSRIELAGTRQDADNRDMTADAHTGQGFRLSPDPLTSAHFS